MTLHRETISVTGATGGAGVATAVAYSSDVIDGWITAIYVQYDGSPPAATTDVTIAEKNVSPAQPILTITNAATDGWFHPLAQGVDKAASELSGQGVPIIVKDYISVTIAQANDADGLTVTLVWEE